MFLIENILFQGLSPKCCHGLLSLFSKNQEHSNNSRLLWNVYCCIFKWTKIMTFSIKKNTAIVIIVSLKVMRQRLFFAWNESALVYAPLVQPDFIFNPRYAMEAEETAWMSNKRRIKREDGERGIPISLKILFPLLLSFSHSSLFSISHLSVGQSSEY